MHVFKYVCSTLGGRVCVCGCGHRIQREVGIRRLIGGCGDTVGGASFAKGALQAICCRRTGITRKHA